MSIKYMNDAWEMPGLNSAEKIVLLAIADWANDDGFAYPSYTVLSKKTGMALTTLSKCLKVLIGVGILKSTSHGEIGTGKKVNTYAITSRLQLPITSDLLLIEKIKELRKESARPITSTLMQRKLAGACTITSTLQDDTPLNTPLKQPSVLDIGKFVIPTLQEITDHVIEKKYSVDPELFLAHYTSNGWVVGKAKAKMKCWKSALVTWSKNGFSNNQQNQGQIRYAKQPMPRIDYGEYEPSDSKFSDMKAIQGERLI